MPLLFTLLIRIGAYNNACFLNYRTVRLITLSFLLISVPAVAEAVESRTARQQIMLPQQDIDELGEFSALRLCLSKPPKTLD